MIQSGNLICSERLPRDFLATDDAECLISYPRLLGETIEASPLHVVMVGVSPAAGE